MKKAAPLNIRNWAGAKQIKRSVHVDRSVVCVFSIKRSFFSMINCFCIILDRAVLPQGALGLNSVPGTRKQ